MAIPNRTTIICPDCGESEDVTIGDSSIGPGGRISERPIYSMFQNPRWPQSKQDGEIYLSCANCGATAFTTLKAQAKRPQRHRAKGPFG